MENVAALVAHVHKVVSESTANVTPEVAGAVKWGFDLHDVMSVSASIAQVSGRPLRITQHRKISTLLQAPALLFQTGPTASILALTVHELARCYRDRLATVASRRGFDSAMEGALQTYVGSSMEQVQLDALEATQPKDYNDQEGTHARVQRRVSSMASMAALPVAGSRSKAHVGGVESLIFARVGHFRGHQASPQRAFMSVLWQDLTRRELASTNVPFTPMEAPDQSDGTTKRLRADIDIEIDADVVGEVQFEAHPDNVDSRHDRVGSPRLDAGHYKLVPPELATTICCKRLVRWGAAVQAEGKLADEAPTRHDGDSTKQEPDNADAAVQESAGADMHSQRVSRLLCMPWFVYRVFGLVRVFSAVVAAQPPSAAVPAAESPARRAVTTDRDDSESSDSDDGDGSHTAQTNGMDKASEPSKGVAPIDARAGTCRVPGNWGCSMRSHSVANCRSLHTGRNDCTPTHAILLGDPGVGKRSIVRLAACVSESRIIEFRCRTRNPTTELRTCIRNVVTGSTFRRTVLHIDGTQLVHEDQLAFL